jgi:hypothetical protein
MARNSIPTLHYGLLEGWYLNRVSLLEKIYCSYVCVPLIPNILHLLRDNAYPDVHCAHKPLYFVELGNVARALVVKYTSIFRVK